MQCRHSNLYLIVQNKYHVLTDLGYLCGLGQGKAEHTPMGTNSHRCVAGKAEEQAGSADEYAAEVKPLPLSKILPGNI